MTRPILADAFAHHVWATQRLIDTCLGADPGAARDLRAGHVRHDPRDHAPPRRRRRLVSVRPVRRALPRGRGGRDVARRAAGGDGARRAGLAGGRCSRTSIRTWSSSAIATTAPRLTRRSGSGSPRSIHHGTDHRSQICTALTTLGIEPPLIDAWDFAESEGRFSETPPTREPSAARAARTAVGTVVYHRPMDTPRLTVALTFDHDAISDSVRRGDPPVKLSHGEFGPRVGAPRILELLAREGSSSTWFVPGHTLETFPDEHRCDRRRRPRAGLSRLVSRGLRRAAGRGAGRDPGASRRPR